MRVGSILVDDYGKVLEQVLSRTMLAQVPMTLTPHPQTTQNAPALIFRVPKGLLLLRW